jgi:hypothetical protein
VKHLRYGYGMRQARQTKAVWYDQIAAVKRAILRRKACYPAWVKPGKLTQAEASRQLPLRVEVLQTLPRLAVEQRQRSRCGREGEGGATVLGSEG